MQANTLSGHGAMLLFSALVAGSFSLGGITANMIDPGALMAMRLIIAATVIGFLVWRGPGLKRVWAVAPWRYLILGSLFSVYFVLMFESLKTAKPVPIAAIFTLTPFLAAGFGWLFLRQVMTPRMMLALCIGAIGAVWMIFRADIKALLVFEVGRGEAIFFIGCIAHALYIPLARKMNRGEPHLVFAFFTLMSGALGLCIFAAPEIVATDWLSLPSIVWFTILYLSLATSALTLFLLQYATMHLPSAKVMAYTYLTPAWVIMLEGLLGHGWPIPMVLVGCGLVATSLLLLLKE